MRRLLAVGSGRCWPAAARRRPFGRGTFRAVPAASPIEDMVSHPSVRALGSARLVSSPPLPSSPLLSLQLSPLADPLGLGLCLILFRLRTSATRRGQRCPRSWPRRMRNWTAGSSSRWMPISNAPPFSNDQGILNWCVCHALLLR